MTAAFTVHWAWPYQGEDLHLVRGFHGPPVAEMLRFGDPGGSFVDHTQANGNGLVSLDIRPRVRINTSVPSTPIQSHDLTVDADGVIFPSVVTTPGLKVSSFWLDITSTITSGSGVVTDERSIHVYVHDAPATTAWATPDPITLRSPHNGQRSLRRPNVYVQFPDGAIADVTPLPGTTFTPDNAPLLTYLEAITDGRQITTSSINAWDPALWSPPWFGTFTATVPPYVSPGLTTTVNVRVEYPWEALSEADRTVTCLDASSLRAADADDAAANVLILGDGFTDPQRLQDLARGLATYTKRLPTFRMLGDRFRFWALPLVGHTGGVTVRTLAADTTGGPHEPPEQPGDDWPPVFGTDLIPIIGYPSTEIASATPPTTAQAAADWSQLYAVAATDIDSGDPANPADLWQSDIDDWHAMSQRVPLNEADTLFGMARGARTSIESDLSFSLHRIKREELDRLLGSLVDLDGTSMGDRWTTAGVDSRLIVMLLEGHTEAAVFSPGAGMVLIGALQDSAPRRNDSVAVAGGPGLDAVPVSSGSIGTLAAAMIRRPALRSTFTHEFGHALGLGDEYGKGDDLPPDMAVHAGGYPNLVLHDDVLGSGFDPDAIGWARWHRIRHAMRLDPADPVATLPTGGHPSGESPVDGSGHVAYEIRFQHGEILGARVGKSVPELAPAGSNTPSEPVLFLRERTGTLGPPDAIGPLTLLWVDEGGDRVVVRETAPGMVPTGLLNLSTDRRTAPIAFLPVPKAAEDDGFARLLPRTVRDHLADTLRPLDAHPESTHPTWTTHDTPSRNSDWPKTLNKPPTGSKKLLFYSRRVPALWSGGYTYNYGLYHPTSHSVMRGSSTRTYKGSATSPPPGETELPPGDTGALPGVGKPNHHGPVGEYLLVDQYAPELHHLVEARLARADPDGSGP